MRRFILVLPWVIVLLAITAALWAWYYPDKIYLPDGTYTKVTETKWKTREVKITTPNGTIQALPENMGNEVVIARGECPPGERVMEVVTTISPTTGIAEIYLKPVKPHLFGFENNKSLGIRGGYALDKDGMRQQLDLFGRWEFFRVGSWHLSGYGEMNTRPEVKWMFQIEWRF